MRALSGYAIFIACTAAAGTVTLMWPPAPGAVAQYQVYVGLPDATNQFLTTNIVMLPRASVELPPGTYRAAVAAVGTNGMRSDLTYSGVFMIEPRRVFTVVSTIQGAYSPEGPWRDIQSVIVEQPQFGDLQFFRASVMINTNGPGPPVPPQ